MESHLTSSMALETQYKAEVIPQHGFSSGGIVHPLLIVFQVHKGSLAVSACVASIVRVVTFNQVNPMDVGYTTAPVGIWTVVEQAMGIICACLPTTRPLFDGLFRRAKNTNNIGIDDTAIRRPLKNRSSQSNLRPFANTNMAGFEPLDVEIALEPFSVFTQASTNPNDELPVVTNDL